MARICVFAFAALHCVVSPVWEVCYLPDYQPVGALRLLGAKWWVPLMTPTIAIGFQSLTIGLLLAVAAGIGPYHRLAPLACIALTVSEGMLRGWSGIHHEALILLLLSYLICGFPAADALTLVGQRNRTRHANEGLTYRAAMVSASLIFSFTYLMVAARRLAAGGLQIFLDDTILCTVAIRDTELGNAGGLGIWACESVFLAWLLRVGFPIVTFFELMSPLFVFSRRFRWLWISVMIPFHVGTGILMGIWFPYNLALIPILVAGWDPFRCSSSAQTKTKRLSKRPKPLSQAA